MLIYKDNIQLDIGDDKFESYQKLGFKKLDVEVEQNEEKKPISKMKVDELKELAQELEIEDIDSLNKNELIAVIKNKQNG